MTARKALLNGSFPLGVGHIVLAQPLPGILNIKWMETDECGAEDKGMAT